MAKHTVYYASFTTKRKTCRGYIGMTKCLKVRKAYLSKKPPSWMKCRGKSELCVSELETDLDGRACALAAEAWYAAKRIVLDRKIVRGACWSKPTLTDEMLAECRKVAKLASWRQVPELLDIPRLQKHLKDIQYHATTGQLRKNNSGAPGNAYRKKIKREDIRGVLKRPAGKDKLRKLHRGADPKARRREETARRPAR